jgi:hypothetical protein
MKLMRIPAFFEAYIPSKLRVLDRIPFFPIQVSKSGSADVQFQNVQFEANIPSKVLRVY